MDLKTTGALLSMLPFFSNVIIEYTALCSDQKYNLIFFSRGQLSIKYPDLYNIGAVCAKLRLENPREIVEATLRQKDYREAIENDIAQWCDSGSRSQLE